MSVINTGSHPKLLWPGIKRVWGLEYKRHEPIWPKMFESLTSGQAYEEDVEVVGFGLMSVKGQGGGVTYDTSQQGYVSRYTHLTYSLGYIVTMEELDDNLYEKASLKRATRLARSVYETEEIVHANVFNRAFTSAYAGGDGKELCATDHPTVSGNQSNELTTAADLSEASIEDLVTQMRMAKDSRGIMFQNKPRTLIVPVQLDFEARRILGSTLQPGTANNDINVLKQGGVIPEMVSSPYLTDEDAWFIRTDCPEGLTHYTRKAATFDTDDDFDTKNLKASAVARWSQGWSNWRGLYGSPGA
jgi:hypothetical protein